MAKKMKYWNNWYSKCQACRKLTDDAVVPRGVGEPPRLLAPDSHPRGGVQVVLEKVALGAAVDDLSAVFRGWVLS